MSSHMFLKATRTNVGLSTLLAFIGFLTSLDFFMTSKITEPNEHFVTVLTYIGPLSTGMSFTCSKVT